MSELKLPTYPNPSDFRIEKISSEKARQLATDYCKPIENGISAMENEVLAAATQKNITRLREIFKKTKAKLDEVEEKSVARMRQLNVAEQNEAVSFLEKASSFFNNVLDWMYEAFTTVCNFIKDAIQYVFTKTSEIFQNLYSLLL